MMYFSWWLVQAVYAEKELVDKVVAVVEDEAIFQSDLEQALKQFLIEQGATSLPDSARELLQEQILTSLISDKLIVAQANKLGLSVSFDEVEDRVTKTIEEKRKLMGGEEAFDRQLALEGLTLDELKKLYREQIRTRLLVDRVIATEIDRSKLRVSEEELLAHYEKSKSQLPKRPEVVHLSTVLFSFESSEDARQTAREKIEILHERILAGEDFAALAMQHSEDPSKQMGGDLGFLNLEDLRDESFKQAAAKLKPGEVSSPVLTSLGYHIIKAEAVDPESGEVRIRHILIRVKPGEVDIKAVFERANAVLDRLLAGEPFDSLAVRYSDDPATAASGGDLGWLKVQDLPGFFQDVLREMKPGDISQILRESSGFRIVKLLGREAERDYTFEEVINELRRSLEQEKLAATYDEYIRSLQDKFYVKIHDPP
ncbi:MAG: hypothetical protein GTO51_02925 [Candidatus Latescibacteria bacterium]|nr:hypothetical protein [Candidatus Latescibacterota bacterium]NIM64926.1 hypothetical protein [Candidatus Latescibacterota bacterium]NIO78841.1 hypothetical protein [Candidatus Latescibacterota bacterium]